LAITTHLEDWEGIRRYWAQEYAKWEGSKMELNELSESALLELKAGYPRECVLTASGQRAAARAHMQSPEAYAAFAAYKAQAMRDESAYGAATVQRVYDEFIRERSKRLEAERSCAELAAQVKTALIEYANLKEDIENLRLAVAFWKAEADKLKNGAAPAAVSSESTPGANIARAISNHDRASTHMGLPLHDKH
jgi:hypothetical protein